jgi:hypothetical protein
VEDKLRPNSRRLSKRLMAGLLVLPIMTVWLLLRHGYSIKQRLGGFALAIVGLAITIFAIALVQVANMTPEERRELDERASERAEGRQERQRQEEAQKASKAVQKATCGGDIDCAAKRARSRAEPRCARLIEDSARYRYEWTDGLGSKFFRAEWSHYDAYTNEYGPKRIIEFRGNALRLENGFGAFQKVVYECDFDPVEGEVLAVRIK